MTDIYQRLQSHLPPRHSAGTDDFASDLRSVRAWVAALPMANATAVNGMVLDALRQINRQQMRAAVRLTALELLREPVAQLSGLIEKQILGSSFPLPLRMAKDGIQAQQFQQELMTGYLIALCDLVAPAGAISFLKRKHALLAIVRALQHGGECLQRAYFLYRTPPGGIWQALHDVYVFAASRRVTDRPVDDPLLAVASDARAVYGHALLLALANPYRFTQRELAEVIACTRTLAPFCKLGPATAASTVLVDADRDQGPQSAAHEHDLHEGLLAFELEPAIAFVNSQLAMLPPGSTVATLRQHGGPGVSIDVAMIRRLLADWTYNGARDQRRLDGACDLDIVVGMQQLHLVLTGGEEFEAFIDRLHGLDVHLSGHDGAATWLAPATQRVSRLRVQVLDQSTSGYRLAWERTEQGDLMRAKVGELIGLSLPDEGDGEPEWMVGVIRWLRSDADTRVQAGIQLLARRALPVAVRTLGDIDQGRAAQRALLLTATPTERSRDYRQLLTPPAFDRKPGALELALPPDPWHWQPIARVERVVGLDLIDATSSCLQFALHGHGVQTAATYDAGARRASV